MTTLLCRLVGPRWLGVILPDTHARTPYLTPRDRTRQLAGGGRSLTGYSRALSRKQHTEAEAAVEVDLKRLDGEDNGIAEVLMCRHVARNSLGHVFVSQMRELVSTLSNDSAVRVVVFRSLVPGVFCAGADLKERALMNNSESDLFVHNLRSLMTQIALLPMPTIAAVDGAALGGGLELALACDLRSAAYSAQMGLIETTRGLLPGAGGSQRLPRMVGMTLAKELIFTGRRVGGQTALEMGLVNRAVEQNQTGDAAYREALSLAREILPQAPIAVRMAKEAMNRGFEVDISSAMAIERMCYARVIPTRDRQEGMAAFIEKRPPRYTGE
ncbi:enoyl-CoA hydratase domain-containing protein 2, mitochondrial isoform X1 [Thunnus albacares]|uniref:enoyl-CoA hydratase domain-containing protein 2, mitochondrial isoform X1 n=1 Tax=Thunnus maccoyii TaxID=8240 RepID=UPI001C4D7491|nr:enoyl-CoA hydratase domain-containing protein 2, mitochondrial isoform X1 [Thunnus maccoyii]XP_044217260.1 enoyl-CoA hydratase domain-containing protein 2, mitochondrial isoform X1 [Thunnus albacares]